MGASTIDGASYTVDAVGNRTAKTDQRAAVTSSYGYYAVYQLSQTTQGANTTETYSYDPVGNRLSSLGVSPYSYNASNQLTSTSSASYTYDYNGNAVSKTDSTGTTQYSWDFENRLTQVTLPGTGGSVSFKYDPLGRRIEKVSPTFTSIFAYDGDDLIEETNATGAVVARYTQTQEIDEPLAMLRSSATSYYHADGLGSVTSLSNGAGALAQTYSFDSFGKTTPTGSLMNPFQYTGREFDTETNLYFYRARYYDPFSGRFVAEDPGRFPGGINFYTYVENDPVGLVDPFGFCPWQVHTRPLKGLPVLPHYYFYNTQTGQSIGLGPATGVVTGPVPGNWETHEKPGNNVGPVPDWACNCVDKKAKNPGKPPSYCTLNGKPQAGSPAPCVNCMGWVNTVLQDCYNQAYTGQQ